MTDDRKSKHLLAWREFQKLWNEWDPLAAALPGGVQDEYDRYVEKTFHMLQSGASTEELTVYLSHVLHDQMDFSERSVAANKPEAFATKMHEWYSQRGSEKEFAAFVCSHILSNTSPVLLVSHAEGDWQFLCGGPHPDDEIPVVVGINHLFERDPTLLDLKTLPDDWEAERTMPGAEWRRRRNY